MRHLALFLIPSALLPVVPATAQCTSGFTETFTGGSNEGGWLWGWGSGGGQPVLDGGNPGEFIGALDFLSFSPKARPRSAWSRCSTATTAPRA